MATPQERLVEHALAEVGYFGKKTNSNLDDKTANGYGLYNKYARDLDLLTGFYNGRKNGYDWCDIFADWNYVDTFGAELGRKIIYQPLKSCGAGCKYSMGYYKSNNAFYTKNPQSGDQVFFGYGNVVSHTGIVNKSDGKYVYTIEGNAGSPSAVRQCRYLLTYNGILGYGRPNWKLVENTKPVEPQKPAEPSKEDDDMITQEQYETMYNNMRKKWKDNDCSEWSKEAREWAVSIGIITGTGDNNFSWEDIPTREQLATMLYRYDQHHTAQLNAVMDKLDELLKRS